MNILGKVNDDLFLPFLYCTRTLWQAGPRAKGRTNRGVSISRSAHQTASAPRNEELSQMQITRPRLTSAYRISASSTNRSTITRSERQAFDKIFRSLARDLNFTSEEQQEKDRVDERNDTFDESLTRPEIDLNEILDVGKIDLYSEKETRETTKQIHSTEEPSWEQSPRHHYNQTFQALQKAKTDKAVADALEKYLFGPFKQVMFLLKTEKKEAQRDPNRVKTRKRRILEAGSGVVIDTRSPQPTAPSKPQIIHSKSITTAEDLAAVSSDQRSMWPALKENYAELLVTGMRVFRQHFPISPFALQVLPRVKSFGRLSEALGCSTELYNEVLYQRFVQHGDMRGIVAILREMETQYLEPDRRTLEMLAYLQRYWQACAVGRRGAAVKAWYGTLPMQEDYAQFDAVFSEIRERARGSMAVEDGDGVEGGIQEADGGDQHEADVALANLVP